MPCSPPILPRFPPSNQTDVITQSIIIKDLTRYKYMMICTKLSGVMLQIQYIYNGLKITGKFHFVTTMHVGLHVVGLWFSQSLPLCRKYRYMCNEFARKTLMFRLSPWRSQTESVSLQVLQPNTFRQAHVEYQVLSGQRTLN